MWDSIIRWSLSNRIIVLLAALALGGLGVYEASRMSVDVLPEITAPTVTVITEAGSLSPEEVEKQVTIPLENALQGINGVRRVRSNSGIGSSTIWVEFNWNHETTQARIAVTERLQAAAGLLPPSVEPPFITPMTSVLGEIMYIGVTWDDEVDPGLARDVAEWEVRRRILAMSGVGQVVVVGGDVTQYSVEINPDKMTHYQLSVAQLMENLQGVNENRPAGFLVSGYSEYLIQGYGRAEHLDQLAAITVGRFQGQPVTLGQVATLQRSKAPQRGTATVDGRPSVVVIVQKQLGADTIAITERIQKAMAELEPSLPEGIGLYTKGFKQSQFIEVAISNVATHIVESAILVVVILIIFLFNVRATIISLIALPLSLLLGVLVLHLLGQSFNTMTLGGIALAIGALVDDAVIDVENVFRRLRERAALDPTSRPSIFQTVYAASSEIRSAIVYATAVIIVVFLPTFFMTGLEGTLLRPLGIAYVATIAASLLVATTVTPVLCMILLGHEKYLSHSRESLVIRGLKRLYVPTLLLVLRLRWAVLVLALAVTAWSVYSFTQFGRSFLPKFNEGSFNIAAAAAPGTSLEHSAALANRLELALLELDFVTSVVRRTGRAERDEHGQDVQFSEMEVTVTQGIPRTEAIRNIREVADGMHGLAITVGQPISHRVEHMMSGVKTSIAIKVFGEELLTLRQIAASVGSAMEGVDGVVDTMVESQTDVPQISIRPRLPELALAGITPGALSRLVEMAFWGTSIGTWWEGVMVRNLVVKYAPQAANNLDTMRATLLPLEGGTPHRLEDLARVEAAMSPNGIDRENGRRRIVVMANNEGRDIMSTIAEAKERIEKAVKLPQGYEIVYGGEFESQKQAADLFSVVALFSVIAMLVLIWMALGRLTDALVVMVNLPLALIGGVATVKLTGGILTLASLVGFVTLFGIASRNGIMLINHYHHLIRQEGTSIREAVLRGSAERLAPILMTALSAALALLPIALAADEAGNEIQSPMAQVILGGLLTSTVLNLLVIPAAWYVINTVKERNLLVGDSDNQLS